MPAKPANADGDVGLGISSSQIQAQLVTPSGVCTIFRSIVISIATNEYERHGAKTPRKTADRRSFVVFLGVFLGGLAFWRSSAPGASSCPDFWALPQRFSHLVRSAISIKNDSMFF
jgi:hypothetical protein